MAEIDKVEVTDHLGYTYTVKDFYVWPENDGTRTLRVQVVGDDD